MRVAILADFPLFVIPDFGTRFQAPGHYATWLPQIAHYFSEMPDLDIHWIALSRKVAEPIEVRWLGQTFHVLPAAGKGCRATTLFRKDRQAIRACLDFLQPDLVHGWGTEDVYAFAAVTSEFPNIASMQGILSHLIWKARMHPRMYFQALIELFVLFKADRITVESAWGRTRVLRRNPWAQVLNIQYGVQKVYCDAAWCPNPEKPAAIFVGRVDPMKGIQDVVAAFSAPSLAHAELWIVGDGGALYEDLKNKSTNNVKWFGRQPPEETVKLMSKAWCLVLPTRADTSPNVVKEARMVGLPVISTPHGGQTAYIQHGENGFLVEPEDIPLLTRYLAELLGDLQKTKAFGACNHDEHRAVLNPMETARKFHALYLAMDEASCCGSGKS